MFEWVGKTVQGGWNAIDNVINTIGKGASTLVSGFFPTPQRTTIKSDIMEQAGTLGQTFRITDPDTPSMLESYAWAANQWLKSPYEEQYSIPSMRKESSDLAAKVTAGRPDVFDRGLEEVLRIGEYAAEKIEKVTTVADRLGQLFGWVKTGREYQGPKEIGSSPGPIIHITPPQPTGADTVQDISNWLSKATTGITNLLSQAKGLFNLGYSGPTGAQPAFSIKHELQPTKATTIGLVAAAVVVLILVLLLRKK